MQFIHLALVSASYANKKCGGEPIRFAARWAIRFHARPCARASPRKRKLGSKRLSHRACSPGAVADKETKLRHDSIQICRIAAGILFGSVGPPCSRGSLGKKNIGRRFCFEWLGVVAQQPKSLGHAIVILCLRPRSRPGSGCEVGFPQKMW